VEIPKWQRDLDVSSGDLVADEESEVRSWRKQRSPLPMGSSQFSVAEFPGHETLSGASGAFFPAAWSESGNLRMIT
jgi:hypothetical protein